MAEARLLNILDQIERFLTKHFWLLAFILTGQILVWDIIVDVHAKLWLDEIYTLHMAQLPNPSEIVRATIEGCDAAPPLYAIIVHFLLPWFPSESLAVRLPSTLAYFAMIFCLLAYCRRRFSAVFAWVATLLVCSPSMWFGTEGRGYAIMLACASGALLSWHCALEGQRRIIAIPALAFCLSLMTAVHYYAIFFAVPLLLAELVRVRGSRKLDFAVVAAMLPSALVFVLYYPVIEGARKFQAHYWSPASWHSIPGTYKTILFQFGLLPVCVLVLCALAPLSRKSKPVGLSAPEWVAAGAFFFMPFFVIVLSIYTTHAFVERYIFWAFTGIGILAAALVSKAARNQNAVGISLILLLLGVLALRERSAMKKNPDSGEAILHQLSSLPPSSDVVVVADHFIFTELAYLAPPRLRNRLVFPVSEELDVLYQGADSGALMMDAISHRSPLHILSYARVLADYPHFILASRKNDYLAGHLRKIGYQVVPINLATCPDLYRVDAPRINGGS